MTVVILRERFCKDPEMCCLRGAWHRVGPHMAVPPRLPHPCPRASGSRKQDAERLRARQSIYSRVLSARCCFFGCIYIFTFSSVTHGFSTWLRNGGGGWIQRVEVQEVEPDGPDGTWAPEGPAWVTGSPAPGPFPVAGGGPQASGHFSALALSAPPPERLTSLDTHKARGSTGDCPASHRPCHREQGPLPLWDKPPVLGNGSSDSSLWGCCED